MLHGTAVRPRVFLRRSGIVPSLWLPFDDMGAGQASIASSVLVGAATFTRATQATTWGPTGLLLTVNSGVPRSSYTELTGASYLGLYVEGARTNNCLWNRDFTNAAWVKTTMTALLDQTGIDGVANSCSSLLATGANATVKQTITIAAVNRPYSVYIKRLVGSGNIDIAQDGAAFTTQTLGAGWTRCTLVASQLNPVLSIRIVTSGDKIAVDYAALEDAGGGAATFPSAPIATTTAAVTRNGDSLSCPMAGNVTAAGGTVYMEYMWVSALGTPSWITSTNSGDTRVFNIGVANAVGFYDAASGASPTSGNGSSFQTVQRKLLTSWSASSVTARMSGSTETTQAITEVLPGTALNILGAGFSGFVKNFRVWNRQLPVEQRASLVS